MKSGDFFSNYRKGYRRFLLGFENAVLSSVYFWEGFVFYHRFIWGT